MTIRVGGQAHYSGEARYWLEELRKRTLKLDEGSQKALADLEARPADEQGARLLAVAASVGRVRAHQL